MTTKKYMSVKEIVSYLGISRPFVYKLLKSKQIPHIRLGKKYLFNIENIEKYLTDKQIGCKNS